MRGHCTSLPLPSISAGLFVPATCGGGGDRTPTTTPAPALASVGAALALRRGSVGGAGRGWRRGSAGLDVVELDLEVLKVGLSGGYVWFEERAGALKGVVFEFELDVERWLGGRLVVSCGGCLDPGVVVEGASAITVSFLSSVGPLAAAASALRHPSINL